MSEYCDLFSCLSVRVCVYVCVWMGVSVCECAGLGVGAFMNLELYEREIVFKKFFLLLCLM